MHKQLGSPRFARHVAEETETGTPTEDTTTTDTETPTEEPTGEDKAGMAPKPTPPGDAKETPLGQEGLKALKAEREMVKQLKKDVEPPRITQPTLGI